MTKREREANNDVVLNGTYPGETNGSNAVRKHVAQNGRERVARWEVSVKPRVLPVGHLFKKTRANSSFVSNTFATVYITVVRCTTTKKSRETKVKVSLWSLHHLHNDC